MSEVELKEYLENLIEALRRETAAQREGDLRARELAMNELNRRLSNMNEFRGQIQDERSNYVRVDTFRWTVGFIVSLIVAAGSIMKLWR